MNIYRLDPLQDTRWAELVTRHPGASVFHTPGWLEAIHRTYGYRPVVFTTSSPTSELNNGLVFCRIRSWLTGRRIVSLSFSDHCEALFDSPEELHFLLSYLQAELAFQNWEFVEIRPVHGEVLSFLANTAFLPVKSYYLHKLDLRAGLDSLFASFDKDSVQRRVRRAERAGLAYERGRSDELLRKFYRLMVLTRRRHRLPPQPLEWFGNLIATMGECLEIHVVSKDRVAIATILTLRFKGTLVYKYGGSDARFNHLAGMTFLFWQAIQEAKATGAVEFDLGRSDLNNSGLITFKDRWAASRSLLTYWRCGADPARGATEGWKMRAAKGIFARMPDSLLMTAGKLLYKHIG